jgi:GMP synthase-like glutamine amidotransferase
MRIHYLQHVPFEDLGNIAPWALAEGHSLAGTQLYAGQPLPKPDDFDWLIILGGPMNVYEHDRYPWLPAEKALISAAIGAEKRLLGICLGAQLIADVLGGPVTRSPQREIGWFPVSLTAEGRHSRLLTGFRERFVPFHWHGDTFAIPPGATHLARSDACPNQAFQFGPHVLGLQFHLEYSYASVASMLKDCGDELSDDRFVQQPEEILAAEKNFQQIESMLHKMLEAMAA